MTRFVVRRLLQSIPTVVGILVLTFALTRLSRVLFERCDLHSIAEGLRANDKVRLFSNENDFLLRPEDVTWL